MPAQISNGVNNQKIIGWILRIAVAGEFAGHGVFALQVKQEWIPYFTSIGISVETATMLLPLMGILDISLALLVLIKPIRLAILWMAFWGFLTALMRPIAGQPIWDFIERWANWGAPLALLLLLGWPKNIREWLK